MHVMSDDLDELNFPLILLNTHTFGQSGTHSSMERLSRLRRTEGQRRSKANVAYTPIYKHYMCSTVQALKVVLLKRCLTILFLIRTSRLFFQSHYHYYYYFRCLSFSFICIYFQCVSFKCLF